eukprot:SAG31_NODE_105_length_25008_cov_17.439399_21_plen_207_part_00
MPGWSWSARRSRRESCLRRPRARVWSAIPWSMQKLCSFMHAAMIAVQCGTECRRARQKIPKRWKRRRTSSSSHNQSSEATASGTAAARDPPWNDSCRARLAEVLADSSLSGTLGALSTGIQQGERWMLDDKNHPWSADYEFRKKKFRGHRSTVKFFFFLLLGGPSTNLSPGTMAHGASVKFSTSSKFTWFVSYHVPVPACRMEYCM